MVKTKMKIQQTGRSWAINKQMKQARWDHKKKIADIRQDARNKKWNREQGLL